MGRRPLRKKGAFTNAEKQRRFQAKKRALRKREAITGKIEARAAREAALAGKIIALPDRRYGVIVADPEWRFEVYSELGMSRSAENHYCTSALADIKARDVASIAADDCVLFLWATISMNDAAHEVMRAWGFTYRSQYIWDKGDEGTGYWNRERHEILLIGTRGNPPPCPAMGTQWPSVICAPRGKRHSEKPEIFLEMIETYYPTVPKIELNRRGPPRPGWDAWGDEVTEIAAE